jgi:hypothetical protein
VPFWKDAVLELLIGKSSSIASYYLSLLNPEVAKIRKMVFSEGI